MQNMLTKLLILLVALIGWVIYSKMDKIKAFLGDVPAMPEIVSVPTPTTQAAPKTTTVYKWQDASGEWHISSTPPAGVSAIETKTYTNDANVVPALRTKSDPIFSGLGVNSGGNAAQKPSPTPSPLEALATEDGRNFGNLSRGLQQLRDLDREKQINGTVDSAH